MSDQETLRDVVTAVASSPKVAAVVSTSTTVFAGWIGTHTLHGALVDISMLVGMIVTALLGLVHWGKYKLIRKQLATQSIILDKLIKDEEDEQL